MLARVIALLLVACAGGTAAGTAARAGSGNGAHVVARIPALPLAAIEGPLCPVPTRFRGAFERAAHETRLPLARLVAVARVESRFQPNARSSAGARGLLQVMPTTAAEVGVAANDPASNVLAGARYLRRLLDRFGSTDLALAAYNAGPTAVAAAGGAPSGETMTYVTDVARSWRALAGCR